MGKTTNRSVVSWVEVKHHIYLSTIPSPHNKDPIVHHLLRGPPHHVTSDDNFKRIEKLPLD